MNKYGFKCYTYLIGWPQLDTWYYGSRSANKSNPKEDLFVRYFTSSNSVRDFIIKHGLPTSVKVHKLFDSKIQAELYETKFLRRVNAMKSPRWLNRTNNSWPSVCGRIWTDEQRKSAGRVWTEEQRIAKSIQMKAVAAQRTKPGPNAGKKFSAEWRAKIAAGNVGKHTNNKSRLGMKHSEAAKQKIGNAHRGKVTSDETKRKISESLQKRRNVRKSLV